MTVSNASLDVLSASALEVAQAVHSRAISAQEALATCIARIEEVNPALNAVVHKLYDSATIEAARIDALSTEERRTLPLAGVPCTIKEFFAVEGAPWTGGLVARKNHLAQADAPTVARLRNAGAVVVGTTNVPEGGIWFETYNGVYGRTNNPWDLKRTPGGSSGGEGAIIAAGGSVFGLGSDIGGSVRLPAAFCGIASHKPTGRTIPNTGQFPAPAGEALTLLSPGPMAKRASDLMPLLRILAGPDQVDPYCVSRELGEPSAVDVGKLVVFLAKDNGRTGSERVMQVAVEDAAIRLERRGATIRTFDTKKLAPGMEVWGATLAELSEESYEAILASGSGRSEISILRELALASVGRSNHTFAALAIGGLSNVIQRLTAKQAKGLYKTGQALKREFSELLGENSVLLMPPFPCPAPKHHAPWRMPLAAAYTALFNVLETPATVVPVGFERRGLPVALQVVAAQGKDHLSIRVAELLEEEFGGWVLPTVGA